MKEIWISNVSGKVPKVSQLELATSHIGYNRVDGLLFGLKITGGVKTVICIGEGIEPGTTHDRLHSMISGSDHAPVESSDYDKVPHTNELTGDWELIPTPRDKYIRFTQNIPSAVWEINHNMNKNPSVTVVDSAGTCVEGQVQYTDNNNLVITFSADFSGFADLN